MKQLGVRTLRMQGQDQTGVSLLRVLRAAGVRELKNVAVHGAGIRDTGYLWLTTDRITGDVLLSFARRGTVKLCGSRISQEDRVRDVTEIAVDAAARNKKSRQE